MWYLISGEITIIIICILFLLFYPINRNDKRVYTYPRPKGYRPKTPTKKPNCLAPEPPPVSKERQIFNKPRKPEK